MDIVRSIEQDLTFREKRCNILNSFYSRSQQVLGMRDLKAAKFPRTSIKPTGGKKLPKN